MDFFLFNNCIIKTMKDNKVNISDIKQAKKDINNLPKSFSVDEIVRMYSDLKKDLADMTSRKMPFKKMEGQLHNQHKTLAMAYPTIFFKTVRGEMDHNMFFSMMFLKKKVESGEITEEQAKNSVIDAVKRRIEKNGPTPKKEAKPGESTTEFTTNVKMDD